MVSKNELQAEIDELRSALKSEREQHKETARVKHAYERDNDAHRARESARMQREHAEQQRKRKEAEREDKRKRRQQLNDGLLRISDAFKWSFDQQPGEAPVLHLSVQLDGDTYPIVRGVIDRLNAPPRTVALGLDFGYDAFQRRMQEAVNKTLIERDRIHRF